MPALNVMSVTRYGSLSGYDPRTPLPPPPEQIPPFNGAAHRLALQDSNIAEGLEAIQRRDGLAADAAFRRAGNPVSEYLLGQFYTSDHGRPRDWIEAAEQLYKSAMAGYAPVQAALGNRYENGIGVKQSIDIAYQWYRFAAAQGEDTASSKLALAMITGEGLPVDYAAALHLLNRCAKPEQGPDIYNPSGDKGGPACQVLLGAIYEEGRAGLAPDPATAFHWIKLSAEQHMPIAEKHLAEIYEQGRGTAVDPKQAAYWRDRAATDADKQPGYWTVW